MNQATRMALEAVEAGLHAALLTVRSAMAALPAEEGSGEACRFCGSPDLVEGTGGEGAVVVCRSCNKDQRS